MIGITLTGVLAAVWNDNREGGLAARIAKFIIVLALAGGFVGFFAVALHVRCVRVVGPAWPGNSYGRDSLGLRVGLVLKAYWITALRGGSATSSGRSASRSGIQASRR